MGDLLMEPAPRWVASRLGKWFDKEARDLPWRRTKDPYAIWISEIMLQQTQVATVIPYFERFLKRFPNVAALAEATLEDVLKLWEGLGYYRRARGLHAAAKSMVAEDDGKLPDDPTKLASLPGFGRYTIGAILSQAFDRRMPILEANSRRVLCRLLGLRGDPFRNPLQAELWRRAESLTPAKRPGRFNQALMELGAVVCKPERPGCHKCPLAARCMAYLHKLQDELPQRRTPRRSVLVDEVAVVLRKGRRVLITQRPNTGRWAGLWEFPHTAQNDRESSSDAALRTLSEMTGLTGKLLRQRLVIRHAVMHYRIALHCFEASCIGGRFRSKFYVQEKWVLPEELADFPVSSPQRRLAQSLVGEFGSIVRA